jgi:hypothetical protein
MIAIALVVGVGIAGTPLPAAADEPAGDATLVPGKRLRFRTLTEGRRTATFVAVQDDVLVVRLGAQSAVVRVPLADVRTIEVSTGKRSLANEGALIGAVPGVVVGGFLGSLSACFQYPDCDRPTAAVFGALVLGTLAALIGAAFGAMFSTDRWQRLDVPQASVRVVPVGGKGVGLRVSF